jgi:predicted TIM-barrel fold metal-dependent hydrolase
LARKTNDQLAAAIANNTVRFGGFASLSMHNATTAAHELKRAVVELGFLGALINDYRGYCYVRNDFSTGLVFLQSSQVLIMVAPFNLLAYFRTHFIECSHASVLRPA